MSTIIPIRAATLDIIQELNGGVRPEVTVEDQFFIYKGKDEPADIVPFEALSEIEEKDKFWEQIVILYSE